MCNGAIYTDELKNWTEIHSAKLDALDDIISENSDENLLIAYNYKTDLIRLQARYPDAVVLDKNPDTIAQWNKGQIKMLLAHPASAGMGINLQHGGSIIVWFGLNWSLELYQQFNGRLHRQGQTKPVRVVHIVADGCIDDKVMLAIENKAETQQELLNALKLI
jgi:SNF2 family DNA or RNA helicase